MAAFWNFILQILVAAIFCRYLFAQDVDGSWSPWTLYPTSCSKSCGGGTQAFYRSCSNPMQQGAGKTCSGSNFEEQECNTEACITKWSDWSSCDVSCDIGKNTRHTICGADNCTGSQWEVQSKECVSWNKSCPSPCSKNPCPEYAMCVDYSTDKKPIYNCTCVMGYRMNEYGQCARAVPTAPPPRPIPVMPPEEKVIAIVITRTASTILLITVGFTLLLFAALRIFTMDRIIQMNMEIALEGAHLVLLFPNTMAEDNPITCRTLSILLHYLFTVCFMFIFLESIHMYSMVAYVVQKNGLLSLFQNILAGWGLPAVVMLFTICFHYEEYGGEYQCWLQVDTPLIYGQYIPIVVLVLLTFTMTEAAGNAEYKPLENVDYKLLFSAKISQRSNIILMSMIFASWILGMLSDYEQNLALYSSFSILNAIIGIFLFFSHSLGNQEVRRKLRNVYESCRTKCSRTAKN